MPKDTGVVFFGESMAGDPWGQFRLELFPLELTATIVFYRPTWDSNRVLWIDASLAKDCTHGPSAAICSHGPSAVRYSAQNQSKRTPLECAVLGWMTKSRPWMGNFNIDAILIVLARRSPRPKA